MDKEILKKLKNKVEICKDFFASFKRLPNPLQVLVIKRVENLVEELLVSPEKASHYDRDLATANKYFPNNREVLDSGNLFPFRSVRLPKDEENNDVVTINFVSCYLANRLNSSAVISANFSKSEGGFTDNKICLVSCSYVSFSSYE